MTARILTTVLIAGALCLAPSSLGQTPKPSDSRIPAYAAPRTPFGHPSLEGVWTSNFMMLLEGSPGVPLVLPEKEARVFADRAINGFAERTDKGLDPELPEVARSTEGLPIVRGERKRCPAALQI